MARANEREYFRSKSNHNGKVLREALCSRETNPKVELCTKRDFANTKQVDFNIFMIESACEATTGGICDKVVINLKLNRPWPRPAADSPRDVGFLAYSDFKKRLLRDKIPLPFVYKIREVWHALLKSLVQICDHTFVFQFLRSVIEGKCSKVRSSFRDQKRWETFELF